MIGFLQGGAPELEEMVAVRNAMVRETDLRQPMDLGQQLLNSSGLADDVGEAMVNLLQVLALCVPFSEHRTRPSTTLQPLHIYMQ